jgi:hypothetical protein
MGGIAFLLVIFLYFVISVALVAKAPTLNYKIVALLAVLLIPTADAIYGRIKLNQMCKADGGLKVYQVAHNVEGYMDNWAEPTKFAVEHQGYKFSESKQRLGVCDRVSMQNGELVYEKNVTPISKYFARHDTEGTANPSYWYDDTIVESYPEGKVLARNRIYIFDGGWAERFMAGFGGDSRAPVACEGARNFSTTELVELVLKRGDK